MRRNLIGVMLDTQARLRTLPPPHDWRCFYTVNELTHSLGRPISLHTANVMRHLGWTRTVRKINGKTQRVWFPPGVQPGPVTHLSDINISIRTTTTNSIIPGGADDA